MVKLLDASEVDPITEQAELLMTEAEEAEAHQRFAPAAAPGDLSDGGMVGGVRVRPMQGGRTLSKGRAAARLAWMWNGTESVLPLGWNPEGTRHNAALPYLAKRHCLCCNASGFVGGRCPYCAKTNCTQCMAGTDRAKVHTLENGKTIRGWLIPCFYLRKDDVPFPARFYGPIPCFLALCPRRGERGFLTEQDMRVHAASRHRMEYRAHVETINASRTDELEALRRRVDSLVDAGAVAARIQRRERRKTERREAP